MIPADGVPRVLSAGTPMQKISSKKIKQVVMRITEDSITWAGSGDSKIPINQIRELRLGQPPTDNANAARWITVVYVRSNQWKVLHMIALTDDVYKIWVDTLSKLVAETSDRMVGHATPSDPDTAWIRQLWPAGAKSIDWSVAVGLCRSIGLAVPQNRDGIQDKLDIDRFRALVQDLQTRPDLDRLFKDLTKDDPLTQERVERFLRVAQGLDPQGIFAAFEKDGIWSLESLSKFLASPTNNFSVVHDMTRPISEYFISSSHNTYLVGEQWRGESTVEGYIRVLLADCRCVEIDVHDGDDEPVAHHRVTLTSSVSVRSICQAIRKYAFINSPYPVIISAETRCSPEQGTMLAAILREELGPALVTEPMDGRASLPSPEELKYRILFKTKPPEERKITPVPSPSSLSPRDSVFSIDSRDTDTTTSESDSGIVRLARRISIGSNSDRVRRPRSPKSPVFSPELLDLLVYTYGVKYRGFSKLSDYEARHQFSVSEKTGAKVIKENKQDWIKHNFSHLSRVYPRGTRLQSTNYDPVTFWSAGCQLVAINWQTVDDGALLNHAMFVDTDGYVLKPLALREKAPDPLTQYRLTVSVISAQRLPLSSDLWVEVSFNSKTRSTKAIEGCTLSPTWNESFTFDFETSPSMLDLTFLHIEIKHPKSKGSLLAQWIRTLRATPRGFHYLPLYDSLFSKYVFATLFAKITLDPL